MFEILHEFAEFVALFMITLTIAPPYIWKHGVLRRIFCPYSEAFEGDWHQTNRYLEVTDEQ